MGNFWQRNNFGICSDGRKVFLPIEVVGLYQYYWKMLACFCWFAQELGTSGTGITEVVHFKVKSCKNFGGWKWQRKYPKKMKAV